MKKYKLIAIVMTFLAIGVIYASVLNRKNVKLEKASQSQQMEIKLYVPVDEDFLGLRTVMIEYPKDPYEMANLLVAKLKEHNVIPKETRLLHFAKDDNGTLYLDFSKEVIENLGDFSEVLTIYSIVNTFISNFRNSSSVQILVEGEVVQTLCGVLYTYLPLEFNEELMEE